MPIFRDTEFMYDVLGTLFRKMMENPEFGPRFEKANIVIQYIISEPKGEIWCLRDKTIVCGTSDEKPTITMTLSGDNCHKFWMKELSLPVAMAKGKIKTKGPMPKILKLLPLLKPAYAAYPAIAKEKGIPT